MVNLQSKDSYGQKNCAERVIVFVKVSSSLGTNNASSSVYKLQNTIVMAFNFSSIYSSVYICDCKISVSVISSWSFMFSL